MPHNAQLCARAQHSYPLVQPPACDLQCRAVEVMAENLLAACAAGIAATLIVTPFDVLKTRLQVASPTHPR